MNIGLFGGSFNPVHFGHLNMALELKEKKGLDAVWFIPSHSPFRVEEEMAPAHHRQKMVELALEGIEGFYLCDLELVCSAPSYTIDTLRHIQKCWPCHSFSLLLGEDVLLRFSEWKEVDEIVRLSPLLVAARPASDLCARMGQLGLSDEIQKVIKKGMVSTRQLEISSTDIRKRLKNHLYCGHLLPWKVLDYISVNQLY